MSGSSHANLQSQMMLMLTESFLKLTNVLGNRTSDAKSDWPKFSGNSKKFRAWSLSIMTQISLHPWKDLYDTSSHDIISTITIDTLNGKLYAKVIT
jgi:hypothetical protein